jgi:hypothetical protein
MEANQILHDFLKELKTTFTDIVPESIELNVENEIKNIETNYYPHLPKILQKDSEFFDDNRFFAGVDLSKCWGSAKSTPEVKDKIWKGLQLSMFAAFLHGDIKEKVSTIFSTVKGLWAGKDDEISKILSDENSEGKLMELIEFVMNTRMCKTFMKIMEEFDISDLELNLEDPAQLMETLKNPEHPAIQKLVQKFQRILQEKFRRGDFTQAEMTREIETVKAKVVGIFGNVFNDALGQRRGNIPAAVLMGNSPEARRARMVARLQKKLSEKNSS